jgi:CRP/FNR family transcriptional regulator, cyclic AMP receptor protein
MNPTEIFGYGTTTNARTADYATTRSTVRPAPGYAMPASTVSPGLLAAAAQGGGRGSVASLAARIDALSSLALLDDAAPDALERLAVATVLRRIERGRRVRSADHDGRCAVLVRGRVKKSVPRGAADGELVLDVLGAGDVVSEACWVAPDRAFAGDTFALESSTLAFVPRKALDRFLAGNGAVATRFLEHLALRLARSTALAAQNACFQVGERLYCRVVELAATRGRNSREGIVVEHGLTQRELAAFAAASREIVNRQLAEWKDRGWVEPRRCALVVKDEGALTHAMPPEARRVGFGAGDGRSPFRPR